MCFVPHLRLLPVPEVGNSKDSPSGWTEGGLTVDGSPELKIVVAQVKTSLVALGKALGVLAGRKSHTTGLWN